MILMMNLLTVITVLISNAVNGKPKAKGSPDPGPWDWQSEQASFPVFNPYPVNQMDKPEFLKTTRNVTVSVGETAFLPCRVKHLSSHTVSWVRASDVSVLSVGHLAFSSDARIGVVQVSRPRLSASDWNLSIKNASTSDDGLYECQVNTEPKINYKVFLKVKDPSKSPQADSPYYEVIDPPASREGFEQTHSVIKKHHKDLEKNGFSMYLHEDGCICPKPQFKKHQQKKDRKELVDVQDVSVQIRGGDIQYVTSGEEITLECHVSGLVTAPSLLLWKKGDREIRPRLKPGISLETEKVAGVSRASLYLASVSLADTGNYTCVTDVKSHTVLLVVTQRYSEETRSYGVQHRQKSTSTRLQAGIVTTLLFFKVLYH